MYPSNKKSTFSEFSGSRDESYSIDSKSRKSTLHFLRFRWTSRYPFFCSFLVGTSSITFFDALVEQERVTHTNFILLLASYVIVAMPLYYMQILLGQYTQMGVILLKYMCPIGHGVGIAFMVLLVVHCFKIGLYMADLLTFCLNSFRDHLQWLHCPEKYEAICWNNKNGCNAMINCINRTIEPSTYFYYLLIYMEKEDVTTPYKPNIIGIPCATRSILLTISWLAVFFVLNFVNIKYQKFVTRMWNITLLFVCVNSLNMFCRDGNIKVIVNMLRVNSSSLTDFEAWAKAISAPLNLMGLGRGFHVIQGSYIDPSDAWESAATAAILINLGVVYICMIFSRSCMNTLTTSARLDGNMEKYVWRLGIRMYFVTIPMALSLQSLPQCWNIIYYITCILIIIGNKFAFVLTIEKSICDAYPVMMKYQKYVSCCICIVSASLGVILSSKEASTSNKYLSFNIANALEVLNTFLFSVVVCWIYGVQKFCDDIHFLLGKQPTRFWKVTWYLLPVFLGFSFIYTTFFLQYHTYGTLQKVMFAVYASPVPLWAICQIFRYAKHKHLSGVFQCEEQFGPPDPRERYLRRLFNPRKETKIKRKSDTCNHKCLLNSKVIKRATSDELQFRNCFKDIKAARSGPQGLKMKKSSSST